MSNLDPNNSVQPYSAKLRDMVSNIPGAALTTKLTTVTCSAPSTPDYAIADPTQTTPFGFSTSDEMLSTLKVVANLQTRLNDLETRLQAAGIIS